MNLPSLLLQYNNLSTDDNTTSFYLSSLLDSGTLELPSSPSSSHFLKGILNLAFPSIQKATQQLQDFYRVLTINMSAVDNITENMAATSIAPIAPEGANNVSGGEPINAAENEAVIAAAAEGRRLYIGNLAYATTEGELKSFFTGFSVFVYTSLS